MRGNNKRHWRSIVMNKLKLYLTRWTSTEWKSLAKILVGPTDMLALPIFVLVEPWPDQPPPNSAIPDNVRFLWQSLRNRKIPEFEKCEKCLHCLSVPQTALFECSGTPVKGETFCGTSYMSPSLHTLLHMLEPFVMSTTHAGLSGIQMHINWMTVHCLQACSQSGN